MNMRGFTLIEVNLAMFIMAVGTLGLVSLYSFGYRENQQSVEDVRGAAVAEVNMNELISALSSTNVTWSQWCGIGTRPSKGWGDYAGDGDGKREDETYTPNLNPTATAQGVFGNIVSLGGGSGGQFYDGGGLACGLVVHQPLYYTEVRFQGLKE